MPKGDIFDMYNKSTVASTFFQGPYFNSGVLGLTVRPFFKTMILKISQEKVYYIMAFYVSIFKEKIFQNIKHLLRKCFLCHEYTNHFRCRDKFLIIWHGKEYLFLGADVFCTLIVVIISQF